jgi:hypothetical protein
MMAIRQRLSGSGIAPLSAQNITGNVTKGAAAAGSGQSTATAIYDELNTVTSGTGGVILRADLGPADEQTVFNTSGVSINVYPPAGGQIQNGGLNTAFAVGNNKTAVFKCIDGLNFAAVLSS